MTSHEGIFSRERSRPEIDHPPPTVNIGLFTQSGTHIYNLLRTYANFTLLNQDSRKIFSKLSQILDERVRICKRS
jgi:hypothetical protein